VARQRFVARRRNCRRACESEHARAPHRHPALVLAAPGAVLTSQVIEERSSSRGSATGTRVGPYVETRDGTQLFFRDWGTGAPLAVLSGWALTSEAATSQPLLDWIEGLMLECSMRSLLDCNKALTATDFRPELARLDVQTLIIHGDSDVSAPLPLTGRKTAALLPHATVKIYEGAPHGLFLTHMERLNKDLLEFVAT
jgi:pimeloyl-ACP methyl ester carboxylesterase